MPGPLRLVLDTNVLLDLVVFRDASVEPLRAAVEARSVELVSSPECLAELRRVLAYPEFRLDALAQDKAYDWVAAHAAAIEPGPPPPYLPRCRDVDDQKFLALAWDANADHLVTKDRALLEVARRMNALRRFSVIHPDALATTLRA